MTLKYEEWKEYIKEDFEVYYNMGFNEKQIIYAVLEDYGHAEDFTLTDKICIHLLLCLNYPAKGLNCDKIVEELKKLLNEETEGILRDELGKKYEEFNTDLNSVLNTSR